MGNDDQLEVGMVPSFVDNTEGIQDDESKSPVSREDDLLDKTCSKSVDVLRI